MYSRPRPDESDEDILKLQELFVKNQSENKISPAAKVVHEIKEEHSTKEAEGTSKLPNSDPYVANTFEVIPTEIKIGQIVERKPQTAQVYSYNVTHNKGFPQAKRRNASITGSVGSIFSQQMKRLKSGSSPMDTDAVGASNIPSITKQLPSGEVFSNSNIIQGEEGEAIHKENTQKLNQMTEEQILEEQQKLLATLDPAIVAFLKAKQKKSALVEENATSSISKQNKAIETLKIGDIETPFEILTHTESERWLNFNKIETNKLAWMKDVKVAKIAKDEAYEARFDFDGWLLPFSEAEISENSRILYHHGEEPGRPGYTLQELFQLSRSSITQQKITSLNTIAKILALQQSGVYDEIIEIPIEQIFFVVRFCVDDNTPSVLNASLKLLHSLFFYRIDETCLDNLLRFGVGMIQPIIAIDSTEQEDDKTVNDQQLAETDLVKCLARTDILTRIRYVINTVRPPLETIVYCLEILTRLARDSDFIVTEIYKCENLIKSIITHFVPKIFQVSK